MAQSLQYARRLVQVPHVSKLALAALIVGLVSVPAAIGCGFLIHYCVWLKHLLPRVTSLLCIFPGLLSVILALVAIGRIVPGFSRLRGLWIAVVGLVFALLATLIGLGWTVQIGH